MDLLKRLTENIDPGFLDVGIKDEAIDRVQQEMEQTMDKVMKSMFLNTIIVGAFFLIVAYLLFVKYR